MANVPLDLIAQAVEKCGRIAKVRDRLAGGQGKELSSSVSGFCGPVGVEEDFLTGTERNNHWFARRSAEVTKAERKTVILWVGESRVMRAEHERCRVPAINEFQLVSLCSDFPEYRRHEKLIVSTAGNASLEPACHACQAVLLPGRFTENASDCGGFRDRG